jgi:hypothetical protein
MSIMDGGNKRHLLREERKATFLAAACLLAQRESQAIVDACLHLQCDSIYEDLLNGDASRLSVLAKRLLEESTTVRGIQLLRLAVTRQLLLQILDRKEVLVWLVRDHPETLSILMRATDFNALGLGDLDEAAMTAGVWRRRKRPQRTAKKGGSTM